MRTPSPDDIDPATLFGTVARSLPRIVLASTAVGALTFGALTLVAPRFQSEAQLTIDAKPIAGPFSDPTKQPSGSDTTTTRMDKEAINTHIKSLMSPALATEIVTKLKLKDNPEFNSERGDVDTLGKLMRTVGLGGVRPGQTELDRVLEAFVAKLDVYAARESRFIGIRFMSVDPQLAADIPNALAEAYRKKLADGQVSEFKDVQLSLKPKIEQLEKEVAAAEVAAEQFRGKTDIYKSGPQSGTQTLTAQQLGELTNELSKAQGARSEIESRANAAKELLRGGSGEALPDVQKSPLIQNLVQQRVRVERQVAELTATLLPGHPRMQQLNADLNGLKKQITAEVSKIVDGLGKEAKVAADREASIKKRLADVKVTSVQAGPDEAKLKMLEADAKSKREALDRLKDQYNANQTKDAQSVPVEAKLVSAASPSSVAVFPKKPAYAAIAAVATFLLGFAWSVLRAAAFGARSGGGRSTPPGGRKTAAAAAYVPVAGAAAGAAAATVAASRRPEKTPAPDFATADLTPVQHDEPLEASFEPAGPSPTMDQPEQIVSHLLSRTPERGGYRTLITGHTDGIDASATAVAIATGLSASGQPTVLVEWSYGSSPTARLINAPSAPGMADLIAGEASFEDVITSLPDSECHFIPAGRGLADAAAALDPDQINLVLDALDEAYAHIVVIGEHAAVRTLFETIEGRFDSGVTVEDPTSPVPVLRDPPGTFLGFEVADIDLVRITRATAAKSATRRLRTQPPGRAHQSA